MPKLHIHRLNLDSMVSKLYPSLASQEKQNNILLAFRQLPILSDFTINCFYLVITHLPAADQVHVLLTIDFQKKMVEWLYKEEMQPDGKSLSSRSHYQMIELIDIIISSASEAPTIMQDTLGVSQGILKCFYKVVERSDSPQLRGKYLDCISKMFRVRPTIFNIAIYAEMLSINYQKIDQFYEFLDYYLLQCQQQQPSTLALLLEGFAKRMQVFSQKSLLTKTERRGIVKAYLKLFDYLKTQLHTSLPEKLLNQHGEIFQSLKSFLNREFNHSELSKVFNSLIAVYMVSKMNNIYKYEFILSILKHVLLKSASLFSFLPTDMLNGEDFVDWFVERQLTAERGREMIECYLKNVPSLQFLLVMAIYYVSHFPDQTEYIKGYMKRMGLLEEAKCFLQNDNIQHYLHTYYSQTNDLEFFDDFMNRVEDMTYRLIP